MPKLPEYKQFISPVNPLMASRVNGWAESAHRWLLPSQCCLCGGRSDRDRDICSGCEGDLPVVASACPRCAVLLPVAGVCGQCQRKPPAMDRTVAGFHYLPPVDAMVKRLKFNRDLRMARLLGTLMADRLQRQAMELPEIIVPVPLHRRRLRERGFNQALELARPVARRLRLRLDWRHVTRIRATDPQSDLPAKLRSRNVKGAFAVAAEFTARRVAIVDDVMTTGHTVNELATMLRRQGVEDISVWVCARAVFER